MKRIITSANAPKAIGPYSQAVEANGVLYISGQLPINPSTGVMPTDIEAQTEQCLSNVKVILEEAGYTFSDVVKSVVLLADMGDFQRMNSIYANYYVIDQPARVCYQVAQLPLGAKIEIETTAVK